MVQHYLDVLLEGPPAQRLLCLAAVVLALAGLDYALVYRHLAQGIARTTAEAELARMDEARLRAELSRLPERRKEAAALEREFRSRLPRGSGRVTPLETVSARAARAGLEVIRFHPGDPRQREHFTEIPLEVEFKGTFHHLLAFFEQPPGPHDPLGATNLAIDAPAAKDGPTLLRITLEMAALVLPPEGGGAAAEDHAVPEAPAHTPAAMPAVKPDRADAGPLLRDPFQPYEPSPLPESEPDGPPEPAPAPEEPRQSRPAPGFQAVGIVWEKRNPVALVRDAQGLGHVVQPGARLGDNGPEVEAITPCEVIVKPVRNRPDSRGTTRLKLPRCTALDGRQAPRTHPEHLLP